MTKTAVLFLGAGFVALVIGILVLIQIINGNGDNPLPIRSVEIIAPKGTQVFARLPGEDENLLGEAPLTVDVRVDATIILRCEDKEKTYLPDSWRNGRINEPSFCPPPPPPRPRVVSVLINAVPWAKVFIKLPKEQSFIKPQREHFTIPPDPTAKTPNVTPIRGGLNVPVGTKIKLVHDDEEKTFGYESWKTSKTISHDFLNP